MAIPPIPQLPTGPLAGGTQPAAPMQRPMQGDAARQKVLMGLALILMSKAHGLAPLSADAPEIAKFLDRFGRRFGPPEPSMGRSELKFLESQLPAQGSPTPDAAASRPGMPPVPPGPPMPQAAQAA